MSGSIEIDSAAVRRALTRAPAVLAKHGRRAFEQSGQRFRGLMYERFRASRPGQYGLLHTRTGRLKGSIGYRVDGDTLDSLQIRVFSSGVAYANLQEFGGTIRPKAPKQFLTIPLPDNLTASLVAREPSAGALRAREPGSTFVIETKRGKLLIGYRPVTRSAVPLISQRAHRDPDAPRVPRSKKDKVATKWLWMLVPEATIPPRLNFVSTWKGLAGERRARVVAGLRTALAEVARG